MVPLLLPLLLPLLVAKDVQAVAPPVVFLQVTVINCTSPDDPANAFLQPLASSVNRNGETSQRILLSLPPSPPPLFQNNITGLSSNIIAVSKTLAYVFGMDEPPHDPEGERTVLATANLFHNGSSSGGGAVVAASPVVPSTVAAAQKPDWDPLSARWMEAVGVASLLAQHRTMTIVGGAEASLNEWVELIDTSAHNTPKPGKAQYWTSTVVYNKTTKLIPNEALPPARFGGERAFDQAKGVLYSQGCKEANPDDPYADSNAPECKWAPPVIGWDVSASKVVATLPTQNTTLHNMYYDPVKKALRALAFVGVAQAEGGSGWEGLGGVEEGVQRERRGGQGKVVAMNVFRVVTVDVDTGLVNNDGDGEQQQTIRFPAELVLNGAGSTYDAASKTMTLLLTDPTDSSDWSRGDPKGIYIAEVVISAHAQAHAQATTPVLKAINVLSVMPECTLGQDLRYFGPVLSSRMH